jgi:hypothetical protein
MADKRFCRVEIYEGEEDLLRSRYAVHCCTGGAVCYADGVRHGTAVIDSGDLAAIHPKGLGNLLEIMKSLRPVVFEDLKK